MFIKFANSISLKPTDMLSEEAILADKLVMDKFNKYAKALIEQFKSDNGKVIAPKANDFLYFSAVMMHAAEAALIDDEGNLRKDGSGKELTSHWEKNGDSLRWVCSDPSIKPYANNNLDCFPSHELIKAYKKWAGKPLCVDHKSDSADSVRGLVVDTYYDKKFHRVIALCALDKKNHPELARQIATGVSNCVSMGTGVGKAICYNCGRVARTEKDFCACMKARSCYCEINCDLNPMELSIVVNGADQKAKIKYIIAKTDSLAQYIDLQEKEIKENGLEKVLARMDNLMLEVVHLRREVSDLSAQNDGLKAVASAGDQTDSLSIVIEKLDAIAEKINKFNSYKGSMVEKQGYYQGGGGVNEPALHQVKYPKEDADSIRDKEDKQMQGKAPFPGVGNVNEMYPGTAGGESEVDKKKRLQRLAEAERAERRKQAVESARQRLESRSYWQGGGGVNEPEPGKVKYPKEDADSIRDKEDKQMQGQPPFPGVGAVDKLHPSPASVDEKDELKRKEMIQRAETMKARFVKASNVGDSRWDIFNSNKELIYSATVNQLSNNKADLFFDKIATKEFGHKLVAKVRSEGVNKVAQEIANVPAPAPMPMEEPKVDDMDKGGLGDPKDELPENLDKIDGLMADVRKGIDALLEDVKSGGSAEGLPEHLASAMKLRRKLSKALYLTFKEDLKRLGEIREEIKLAMSIKEKGMTKSASTKEFNSLVEETLEATKSALAEGYSNLNSFRYFAKGASNLDGNIGKHMKKLAQDAGLPYNAIPHATENLDPLNDEKDVGYEGGELSSDEAVKQLFKKDPKVEKPKAKLPSEMTLDDLHKQRGTKRDEVFTDWQQRFVKDSPYKPHAEAPTGNAPGSTPPLPNVPVPPADAAKVDDSNDLKVKPDGSMEGTPEEVGKAMKEKAASERAERRAKLAEKASTMKYDSLLGEAHKGGTKIKMDGVKVSDDLDKVETLEEVQKVMLDSAMNPKVKKQAAQIQNLILQGKLSADQLPEMVAQGLDKDAVSYWKQFYGQVDGGKEFATELTAEHMKAKAEEDRDVLKLKVARSFELAYQMRDAGLIDDGQIAKEANKIMEYNDTAYESVKRMAASAKVLKKQAASVPQVGLFGMEESLVPAANPQTDDLVDQYSRLFQGRQLRRF